MNNSKEGDEFISEQSLEQHLFTVLALAEEAGEEAVRLRAKAVKAEANAEGLFDEMLRLAASLRRRRGEPPSGESSAERLRRTRKSLVKALRSLGSSLADDRASAALNAERLRRRLGCTWDQLIIEELDDDDDYFDDDEDDEDDEFGDDEEPVA